MSHLITISLHLHSSCNSYNCLPKKYNKIVNQRRNSFKKNCNLSQAQSHDLYTQLLACSSSQSVVAIACYFPFCVLVFPIPPSLLRQGPGKYWLVSILYHWIVQCDGSWWGLLAGLPWIPPPHARALPASTNFVDTSAQAHLLVMSLNGLYNYAHFFNSH